MATAPFPPPDSPPTQKPIPQTPGPLSTRLRTLYTSALTTTLKTVSYPNFATCFPTPASKRPEVLKSVWGQIVGKMERKGVDEFESILVERDVVERLNALEGVLGEARGRREREEGENGEKEGGRGGDGKEGGYRPPHSLSAEELYLAHLSPQLEVIRAELEGRVKATRGRNEELVERITRERAEIEALVGGLEGVVRDLESANVVLEGAVEREVEGGKREGKGEGEGEVQARL